MRPVARDWMGGFWPLLKKELREQWRTYRPLIVGSIFLMFGITTPLILKYLPLILESAGEGMSIEMPPPTAAQSLLEYAGTIAQVGVLVAVLVSRERQAEVRVRGMGETAAHLRVRLVPVPPTDRSYVLISYCGNQSQQQYCRNHQFYDATFCYFGRCSILEN